MSLKKCPECGEPVSSSAAACPKCGKPVKKGLSGCVVALLIVIGIAAAIVIIGLFTVQQQIHQTPVAPNGLLTKDEVAKQAVHAVTENQRKTTDPAWLKTKAGKIYKRHSDWPPDVCEEIAVQKVHMGMSADQVREAWGKPDRVNSTITSGGRHEQWVWGSRQYAYFQEGVLTSVQQQGQ